MAHRAPGVRLGQAQPRLPPCSNLLQWELWLLLGCPVCWGGEGRSLLSSADPRAGEKLGSFVLLCTN